MELVNFYDQCELKSAGTILNMHYGKLVMRIVELEGGPIVIQDYNDFRKLLDAQSNKFSLSAIAVHLAIMMGRAGEINHFDIANMKVVIKDWMVMRMCAEYASIRMKVVRVARPLPSSENACFGQVLQPQIVNAIGSKDDMLTLRKAPSLLAIYEGVRTKLLKFACTNCEKECDHFYGNYTYACRSCNFVKKVEIDKTKAATYNSEDALRTYILEKGPRRINDLMQIIMNINCVRLLIPGDCIGFGAIVCQLLGIPFVSSDPAPRARAWAFPGIRILDGTAKSMLDEYRSGDVILLSHVVIFDMQIVTSCMTKKFDVVVYERMTSYPGRGLMQPVKQGLNTVRASSLNLWRSIPITLSYDERSIEQFDVFTKFYDRAGCFLTYDKGVILMMEYWSNLGNKVYVHPSMDLREGSPLIKIDAPEIWVLYKRTIPYNLPVKVSKYIDVVKNQICTMFPVNMSNQVHQHFMSEHSVLPANIGSFTNFRPLRLYDYETKIKHLYMSPRQGAMVRLEFAGHQFATISVNISDPKQGGFVCKNELYMKIYSMPAYVAACKLFAGMKTCKKRAGSALPPAPKRAKVAQVQPQNVEIIIDCDSEKPRENVPVSPQGGEYDSDGTVDDAPS